MTDLNAFLRRVDVEALLKAKMTHCEEKIAELHAKLTKQPASCGSTIAGIAAEIACYGNQRSALGVTLKHLDMLDPFTITHPPALSMPVLVDRRGGYVDVKA
ncbi:MAG TPA: hypothetical protein H9899_07080 [Candidatus Sphingomonas excrementigallinarum]|nr:hypothetical protein [Candidatus Sphingomonas excrementigallinarum]